MDIKPAGFARQASDTKIVSEEDADALQQKPVMKKSVTLDENSTQSIMPELKPVSEASDEGCGFFKMTKIASNQSTENDTECQPAAVAGTTNVE